MTRAACVRFTFSCRSFYFNVLTGNLRLALECLLAIHAPIKETFPLMRTIHEDRPEVMRIWEHSQYTVKQLRDEHLDSSEKFYEEVKVGLSEGRFTLEQSYEGRFSR